MRASEPQPLTFYWYRSATIGATFVARSAAAPV